MKRSKVSLYLREPITRRYKLVNRNKDNPSTTTFVLRRRSTWESLKVDSVAAATAEKIQRELDLFRGIASNRQAQDRERQQSQDARCH